MTRTKYPRGIFIRRTHNGKMCGYVKYKWSPIWRLVNPRRHRSFQCLRKPRQSRSPPPLHYPVIISTDLRVVPFENHVSLYAELCRAARLRFIDARKRKAILRDFRVPRAFPRFVEKNHTEETRSRVSIRDELRRQIFDHVDIRNFVCVFKIRRTWNLIFEYTMCLKKDACDFFSFHLDGSCGIEMIHPQFSLC